MTPKWLPPVAAWALLAFSVAAAVDARHESRLLTRELADARAREQRLEDERRALLLEYLTFADFAQVRAAAEKAGMRDPDPKDGSLVFIQSTTVDSGQGQEGGMGE